MKTYLVTGAAGFIGSHIRDALREAGAATSGVDRDSPWPTFRFDTIVHCAALTRIQPSFLNPHDTLAINLGLTLRTLDFARECGARVIYAGSSTCNGDVYANPYALSKHLGEEACRMYSKLYKVPCAIARFYNVYGPRQIEDGPYATAMGIWERKHREGKPLPMCGNGEKRRDWTHVEDVVSAVLAIDAWLESDVVTFHVGTGRNVSVAEVLAAFGGQIEQFPDRPGESQETLADTRSLRALGWSPKWRIEDYIETVRAASVAS
jgi:UDP-glucose 4-epimerase